MHTGSNFIAIDLGAESGRLVLGTIDGNETLSIKEISRFPTQGTPVHGRLYWNVLRFYEEILKGFEACSRHVQRGNHELKGIGVDTWGVDFVMLDAHDNLVGIPYHYRDAGMLAAYDTFFDVFPRDEVYRVTGIQFMALNTLVQLHALRSGNHPCMSVARSFLMMPDYFNFLLTGYKVLEYTDSSTTQVLDARTKTWHVPFIDRLGLDQGLFPSPVLPGRPLAPVAADLASKFDMLRDVDVHLVGSHDTASAVIGTPLRTNHTAYISSGTWSLLGVESDEPVLSKDALDRNFTNEGGVGGKIRVLKNIMGLWLIQQAKKSWEVRTGCPVSYDAIVKQARDAGLPKSLVFPDDPRFLNPPDMLEAIRASCIETGQEPPSTLGEFAATIFASLACRYKEVTLDLEHVLGTRVDGLHVVGGGSRNELLCQYTADATGLPVESGPDEATAIGNVIVQAISSGLVSSISKGREMVQSSFPVARHEPRAATAEWQSLYDHVYVPVVEKIKKNK